MTRPLPRPRPPVVFLTVAEVAARLRVSKMTVYRLIEADELRTVRVRRSFRVPLSAFDAYLLGAGLDVSS